MAKRTPIASLKLESQDPVGFIKDRQAIRGDISKPENSAKDVFETVKKRLKKTPIWRNFVISRFCSATSFDIAKLTSEEIYNLSDLTTTEVGHIVQAFNTNSQLNGCWNLNAGTQFVGFLNKFSVNKLKLQGKRLFVEPSLDDEIPF